MMPHPVDSYVSRKIRESRISRGLTQSVLAQQIGCSFQQLQKYESGNNRVSASRLYDIAHALQVPVAHFFDGYATLRQTPETTIDPMTSRILFALANLDSDEVKEKLCRMVLAIADTEGAQAKAPAA